MPSDTADYLGADPRDLFPWLRPGANGTMPWSNAVSQVTPNITGPPPNVGMQAPAPPDYAPGPIPSYQPGVNGPMTPDDDAMAALDRYRHAIEAKPQLNKPKWWQQLAAGAAGGLAGWTNAAGRLRHPIDIGAMSEGILHPGYQANLERWKQNQLEPAKDLAEIAGHKQAEWWKGKQVQSQIQYQQAHANYMNGLGRGADLDVTPEMERETNGIFKVGMKIPGSTATEIARIAAGKYEKPEKTFPVNDPELAKRMHVAVGTEVPISIYQAGIKSPTPQNPSEEYVLMHPGEFDATTLKTARELFNRKHRTGTGHERPDELTQLIKEQRLEDMQVNAFKSIDDTKTKDTEQAQHDRRFDVDALIRSVPNAATEDDLWQDREAAKKLKAINRKYAPRLQTIQDAYANSVRRRGGSADDYDVNADTLASSRRAAPVAPPQQTTAAPAAPSPQYAKGTPPPPEVLARVPEGRIINAPDGSQWKKVNGKAVAVPGV